MPIDTPTITPTSTVTATSSPTTGALSYLLTDGSQLFYKLGSLPDTMEALTGSMELVPRSQAGDRLFDFEIRHFDFQSERFHLVGNEGFLTATMQDGATAVYMQISTNVNGMDVEIGGSGSEAQVSGSPPTLHGLEIFGGSMERPNRFHFILYIFAAPLL
jgi:hypothetical protein